MIKNILSLDLIIFSIMSMGAVLTNPISVGQVLVLLTIIFVYIGIDFNLFNKLTHFKNNQSYKVYLLIIAMILIVVPNLANQIVRGNSIYIHDNVQQLNTATKFLLEGKNPYEQNYSSFFINNQNIVTTTGKSLTNPANEHLISLPGHLLLSVPPYLVFNYLLNFYDQRFLYFFIYFITVLILIFIAKEPKNKVILVSLFALNPLMLKFLYEGRNDILLLCFLILTLYLLIKQKPRLASLALGITLSIKHFAVILMPFFIAYYYWKLPTNTGVRNKIYQLLKQIWPLFVAWFIINLPFIIWSPSAFYQDIIAYPLGFSDTSYPISGFGLSAWVEIQHIKLFAPLWLMQIIICLLFLYLLLKSQKKYNLPAIVAFNFTILLFVSLFFSRFFNDNYISLIIQMLIVTYFINQYNEDNTMNEFL